MTCFNSLVLILSSYYRVTISVSLKKMPDAINCIYCSSINLVEPFNLYCVICVALDNGNYLNIAMFTDS